jgi:ribonucleoside-diphosphate reductase alpha chain
MLAWKSGCKGITVYRDGCRDGIAGQVQPMRLKEAEPPIEDSVPKDQEADIMQMMTKYFPDMELDRGQLEELPDIRESLQVKQRTPLGTMHVTIVHEGGEPKEVFGQISKVGEQPAADLEAICRLASLILRLGGGVDMVLKQLERIGSSQLMPTKDGRIMSIPDGLAVAIKRALKELQISADHTEEPEASPRTVKKQRREPRLYREVCPDCQSVLYENSGCQTCPDPKCGYARC